MSYRGGAGGDGIDVRLDGANGATLAANATPGVWTEFSPAAAGRNWMAAQNQDDAAIVYCVKATTQPANGTADGELKIPTNAYWDFDYDVPARWWFRSTVASSKVMRQVA